eukprot:Gb_15977 [translate_table: standard]
MAASRPLPSRRTFLASEYRQLTGILLQYEFTDVKLPNLTSLTELHLENCPELKADLYKPRRGRHSTGFEAAESKMSLNRCKVLKRICGIFHLSKLQMLNISGCKQLEYRRLGTFDIFGDASSGWVQKAAECKSSGVPSKASIDKHSNCDRLVDLPSLAYLTSLNNIIVNGCGKLPGVGSLASLTFLETLEASRCWKLKSIKGLEGEYSIQGTRSHSLAVPVAMLWHPSTMPWHGLLRLCSGKAYFAQRRKQRATPTPKPVGLTWHIQYAPYSCQCEVGGSNGASAFHFSLRCPLREIRRPIRIETARMAPRTTRKSKGVEKASATDHVVNTPVAAVAEKPEVESKAGKGGGGMKSHQKKKCGKKSGGESYQNFIYKLAREDSSIAHYNKTQTLSSCEFHIVVKLILLGELTKHVVSEGTNAVTKFSAP